MIPRIIIVTGYLASGKSSFALRLSKELNVPYFIKDTFEVGGETVEIDTTDFEKVDFNRHIETAQIFIRASGK